MRHLIPWLWAAGALQLVIIAGIIFLPKILQRSENLAGLSPGIREVFIVHWLEPETH
jgi:hypothetical protein